MSIALFSLLTGCSGSSGYGFVVTTEAIELQQPQTYEVTALSSADRDSARGLELTLGLWFVDEAPDAPVEVVATRDGDPQRDTLYPRDGFFKSTTEIRTGLFPCREDSCTETYQVEVIPQFADARTVDIAFHLTFEAHRDETVFADGSLEVVPVLSPD